MKMITVIISGAAVSFSKCYIFLLLSLFTLANTFAKAESAEEIVITGTRSAHKDWLAPIATESMDVKAALDEGRSTVADALVAQPGIEVVSGIRGHSIRLDGLDSKYTAVLIDGQRVNGRIGESLDLDRISLESVERIEIIRGAASALYGSEALGGVINIITKKAYKNRVNLRVGGNSLGQKDVLGSWDHRLTDDFSLGFDAHALKVNDLQLDGGEASTFSGRDERSATLRPHLSIGAWDVDANLAYGRELIDGTDVSAAGAVLSRKNEVETTRGRLAPTLNFDNGGRLQLEAQTQVYRDAYEVSVRRSGFVTTDEDTTEKNQDYAVSYQKDIGSHLLTTGVQKTYETLDSDRLNSDSVSRQRSAFYVQDEWTLGDLLLVPGLRYDDDTQFDDHLSGKFALRYALRENHVIRASYGEGYRAPGFKELYLLFENMSVGSGYVVEGNPELKPEISRSSRLSYDYKQESALWSLELFHNHLTNLIEAETQATNIGGVQHYSYTNVSSAETAGGNLSLRLNWQGDWDFQYGYLQARNLTTGTELYGRSRHSFSYRFRLPVASKWKLTHGLKWQSARSTATESGHPIMTGDAGLEYQLADAWLLSFMINNLTAQSGDTYWRIPPRNLGVAVTWTNKS